MNEVRPTLTPVTMVQSAASLSEGNEASTKSATKKEQVEENQVLPVKEAKKADREDLDEAVSKITEYVQSVHRDLQFSVDDDSGMTVIKVLDGSSGELIRQIPEEVFLDLARKLNEEPLHLLSVQG